MKGLKHFHDFFFFFLSPILIFFDQRSVTNKFLVDDFRKFGIVLIQIFIQLQQI